MEKQICRLIYGIEFMRFDWSLNYAGHQAIGFGRWKIDRELVNHSQRNERGYYQLGGLYCPCNDSLGTGFTFDNVFTLIGCFVEIFLLFFSTRFESRKISFRMMNYFRLRARSKKIHWNYKS